MSTSVDVQFDEELREWVNTLEKDPLPEPQVPPDTETPQYELVDVQDIAPNSQTNLSLLSHATPSTPSVLRLLHHYHQVTESFDTQEQVAAFVSDVNVVLKHFETSETLVLLCVDGLTKLQSSAELTETTGMMAEMLSTDQFPSLVHSIVTHVPSGIWLLLLRLGMCVAKLTGDVVQAGEDKWINFWAAVFGSYLDKLEILVERLEVLLYLEHQREDQTTDNDKSLVFTSVDDLVATFDFVYTGVQPLQVLDLVRLNASYRRTQWLLKWSRGKTPLSFDQTPDLFIYYLECLEQRCSGEWGSEWADKLLQKLLKRFTSEGPLEDIFYRLFDLTSGLSTSTSDANCESARQDARRQVEDAVYGIASADNSDESGGELQMLTLDEIMAFVRSENAKLNDDDKLSEQTLNEVVTVACRVEALCEQFLLSGVDASAQTDMVSSLAAIGTTIHKALRENMSSLTIRSVQWLAVVFSVLEIHHQVENSSGDTSLGSKLIQMQTGEGKALVIVITASYFAAKGRTVDVVTNNDQLAFDAIRDYGYLYDVLKVSCRALASDLRSLEQVQEVYNANVIYGTLLLFAADHLQEVLYGKKMTAGRKRDVLIIDEVDAVLIDRGTDCNMLCASIAGSTKLFKVYGLVHQMVKSYHKYGENVVPKSEDLVKMMRLSPSALENGTEDQVATETENNCKTVSPLNVEINSESTASEAATDDEKVGNDDTPEPKEPEFVFEEDEIPKFFHEMLTWKMSSYIRNSSSVHAELKDGRDYVRHDGDIHPLDSTSSGEIMFASTYSDGVHQFMQLEHQTALRPEGLPATFLSNIGMINLYTCMIGLSATLGDNQDRQYAKAALRKGLQPLFVYLPRHIPRRFTSYPPIFCGSESDMEVITLHQVSRAVAQKRSVLLICADINQGKDWHSKLCGHDVLGIRQIIMYLTNELPEIADRVASELQAGDIVVTTNFGSRGTDYKNHPLVVRNGGLFCIRVSTPANDRVKIQGDGRAGRAGQPGSAIVVSVIHAEDSDFTARAEMYRELQRDEQKETSRTAGDELAWARLKDELFSEFVNLHNHIRQARTRTRKVAVLFANGEQELACLRARFALFLDKINCSRRTAAEKNHLDRTFSNDEVREQWEAFVREIKQSAERGLIQNPFSLILRANDYAFLARTPKQENLVELALSDIDTAITMDRVSVEASAEMNKAHLLSRAHMKSEVHKYRTSVSDCLKRASVALARDLNQIASLAALVIDPTKLENNLLSEQLNGVLSIYHALLSNCDEQIQILATFEDDSTAIVTWEPFLQDEPVYRGIFFEMFDPLGFQGMLQFEEKKKWKFSWAAFGVILLGALELAGGIALTCFGFGGFGVALICEAISDLAQGIEGLVTGSFSLKSFFTDKAISLALSVACGGIMKCCQAVAKQGLRQSLIQLKNAGIRVFKAAKRMAWKLILHPKQVLRAGWRRATTSTKALVFRLKARVLERTSLRHGASKTMREAFKNGWVQHQNEVFRVVASKVVVKGVEVGVSEGLNGLLLEMEKDIKRAVKEEVDRCTKVESYELLLSQFWVLHQHEVSAFELVQQVETKVAQEDSKSQLEQLGRRFAHQLFEKMKSNKNFKLGRIGAIVYWALETMKIQECVDNAIQYTTTMLNALESILENLHKQASSCDEEYCVLWKDETSYKKLKIPALQRNILVEQLVTSCCTAITAQVHRAANMVLSRAVGAAAERTVSSVCKAYINHKGKRLRSEQHRLVQLSDDQEKLDKLSSWEKRCQHYLADAVISRQVDLAEDLVQSGGPVQSRVVLVILSRLYNVPVVLHRGNDSEQLGQENSETKSLHFQEKENAHLSGLSHVVPTSSAASAYTDVEDLNCVFRSFYFEVHGEDATPEQLHQLREDVKDEFNRRTGDQLLSWMYRNDSLAGVSDAYAHNNKHTRGAKGNSRKQPRDSSFNLKGAELSDSKVQRMLAYMLQYVAARKGTPLAKDPEKKVIDFEFTIGYDANKKRFTGRLHYDGSHGHPNVNTPNGMKDSDIGGMSKESFCNFMQENLSGFGQYVSGLKSEKDIQDKAFQKSALDLFKTHGKKK